MNKTLTLISLLTCTQIMAADQLYYFGGGGEGTKASTIFDYNISNVKRITTNHNLNYQISFNGGHKNSEAQLKANFPVNKVNNFTEKNFNNHLKEIERKILKGEIKTSENLLIVIDSHGGERAAVRIPNRASETSHSISLANNKQIQDFNNLSGSDSISLDRLKRIVELAELKGIKLGIVDFSCHSGATQALARSLSNNVCIVSSTGPKHYGYAGNGVFADHFMKALSKPNTNLEEAFLFARKNKIDAGYPMISTPTHRHIANEFYGDLTNLLYYERQGQEGKLVSHIYNKDIDCITCTPTRIDPTRQLKIKIAKLKIQGIVEHVIADDLTKEIERYNQFQQNLVKEYKTLNVAKLSNTEKFKFPEINPETKKPFIDMELTWQEILNSNSEKTDKVIDKLVQQQKSAKAANRTLETFISVSKRLRDKVAQKKDEILKRYPDLPNAINKFNKLAEKNNNSYKMVVSIAEKEKKLYDSLYANQPKGKNACNRFVL